VEEDPTVRVRVRAHPALAPRGKPPQLGAQPAALVEELLGAVAAHPLLEHVSMSGVLARAEHGDLVCSPRAFDLQSVDLSKPRPALGASEDQHRPARTRRALPFAGRFLEPADVVERFVEGVRQSAGVQPRAARRARS